MMSVEAPPFWRCPYTPSSEKLGPPDAQTTPIDPPLIEASTCGLLASVVCRGHGIDPLHRMSKQFYRAAVKVSIA